MLSKLNHIGIIVNDIEQAKKRYEKLYGVSGSETAVNEAAGICAVTFDVGGTEIELLGSLRPDTGIAAALADRGEGLHHLAYSVGDIAVAADELRAAGFRPLDVEPRFGFHGVRIQFFQAADMNGVLTELVEVAG